VPLDNVIISFIPRPLFAAPNHPPPYHTKASRDQCAQLAQGNPLCLSSSSHRPRFFLHFFLSPSLLTFWLKLFIYLPL